VAKRDIDSILRRYKKAPLLGSMKGVLRNKKVPCLPVVCGPLLRERKWKSGLYGKPPFDSGRQAVLRLLSNFEYISYA
jgi:hypothetical protein